MTSKALFSLAFLALTSACQNLEPIDANVCGNRIVEPENGEECDGEANCGTLFTDDEAACRFTCSPTVACPAGYGCGLDGICRQPSGIFETVAEVDSPTLFLQAGDMDGDGRADLFRTGINETAAQFYDDDFSLATLTTIEREPGDVAPLLAQLTFDDEGSPDGRADVALSLDLAEEASGLTIYRAAADRSLSSTAYSTLDFPGAYVFGVAANVTTPTNQDEVIAFVATGQGGTMVGIGNENKVPFVFKTGIAPVNPLELTGVATGRLIAQQSPCDEVVWTAAKAENPGAAAKLYIFEPCEPDPDTMGADWNSSVINTVITIDLPLDLIVYDDISPLGAIPNYFSNVFVADMDGDSDDDIVVMLADKAGDPFDDGKPLFWIENEGDDTWDGDNPIHQERRVALDRDAETGDVASVRVWLESCDTYDELGAPESDEVRAMGIPLAITDLNADGLVDYITDDSIWISRDVVGPTPGKTYEMVASCLEWAKVVVGDFDRNGHKDIAAARILEPGIDVASGAGDGAFTWNVISTQREVFFLNEGDYDGDFVTDLSFLSIDLEAELADGPTDTLSVAFASASGGFETPVTLGTLRAARGLVSGRIQGGDATDDILVASSNVNGDLAVAFFLGDGARQIVAPFLLQEGATQRTTKIVELSSGRFSDDTMGYGVAALTRINDTGTSNLWAVDIQGEADLAGNDDAVIRVEHCDDCMLAPLDLDDDGVDELIVLGDELGKVYRRKSGPNAPFEEAATIADLDDLCFFSLAFNEGIVRDFDDDGLADLAALATQCADPFGTFEVVVLWNDGSGSLGGERMTRIPLEGISAPDTLPRLAAINVDADVTFELAVAVQTSTNQDGQSAGETRIFDVSPGDAGLEFQQGTELSLGGKDNYAAVALTAGDFNGDGVEDLVLSDYGSYIVLRGVPVR